MLQTVEAMIDETGNVRLLEPLHLPSVRRALVPRRHALPSAQVAPGEAPGGLFGHPHQYFVSPRMRTPHYRESRPRISRPAPGIRRCRKRQSRLM